MLMSEIHVSKDVRSLPGRFGADLLVVFAQALF
jgi:hypothetical protein